MSYMQQPMQNPKDISDPTTAFDMALEFMSKAFQPNNTTPTNNNQRSSLNPCYNQIAQSGMNIDQDRQILMVDDNVGNQFRQNAVQNVGHLVGQNAVQNVGIQNVRNQNGLSVVPRIENWHRNGNGVAARAEVPEHTTVETPMNMSPENKDHFESEKEAIHLILTGIGDEIYSTVDACQTAHERWEAIERLQQGESFNIQDPEWSRFVTIVKQQHKLEEVSYHKLFDILKQYQKEVNELCAERLARNANPLALIATAQANQEPYYQTSKYKGKEIAKAITPPSESASKEDNDPEQAQRDKDMQKNLALIAKYFKRIYKPTNNNLRTSSNPRNKNVDTTPRYKNDNQSGQFGNQRTMNVAGARENVGSPVVQQSGIQCFNCKEFSHFAKECRKPKRVKDSAYHKEKMLLCKKAEKGVPLQAKQYDWLADTDEEIDEQKLEAHYSYMAKI
nr:hypothetical protein [Tanacetum cinerariifolium]